MTDFARGNINLNQTAIGGIADYEQNFTYDPTGNWDRYTTHEDGSEVLDQTRAHNQDNQITQIDGSNTGILYDRAGNALQMPPDKDGDWSKYYKLTWDAWNRLVTIKDEADTTVADYQYDGTTRRTLKTVSGTTTHFYYNNLWKCVEERIDAASTPKVQYLWGARPNHRDELIRRDRDTDDNGSLDEKLFCLMDYYNPTSMTDTNGDVVERFQFGAFGLRQITDANWTVRSSSSYDITFAFHGEFRDPESGLENYGYRYYSPHLGRWINKDPIGEEGGVNLYLFAANYPVNIGDLLGLFLRKVNADFGKKGKIAGFYDDVQINRNGGGAKLDIYYTAGPATRQNANAEKGVTKNCCASYRWHQTITTNFPAEGKTSPYVDGEGDDKPWYYTDESYEKYAQGEGENEAGESTREMEGIRFYDFPKRNKIPGKMVTWSGELVLKCLDKNEAEIMDIFSITWGFRITDRGGVLASAPILTP